MKLSRKAALLLKYLQDYGDGEIDEWKLRDRMGLSHGSIVAARKELADAGIVRLERSCRRFLYHLTGQMSASEMSDLPKVDKSTVPEPEKRIVETKRTVRLERAEAGDVCFAAAMPHVSGTYYDFDEWTDALMNALGDCLDISESLVEEGTYTVYSHDYESEDTYHTETTSEGFIVN